MLRSVWLIPREDCSLDDMSDESTLMTVTERGIPLFMNNTLTIQADRLEEYLSALTDVLPQARAEVGCIYLNVGFVLGEPNVIVLSEGWRDLVEYRDEVLARDYFQKYLTISEQAYAEPRVVRVLGPLEPLA